MYHQPEKLTYNIGHLGPISSGRHFHLKKTTYHAFEEGFKPFEREKIGTRQMPVPYLRSGPLKLHPIPVRT